MSAQHPSRAYGQGKVKKNLRMKQPLTLQLPPSAPPRNPVALALMQRSASGAAGKHMRTHAAQRRADKVALTRATAGPRHAWGFD